MRRERERVERWGRRASLESGGARVGVGVKVLVDGERVVAASRKEDRIVLGDLER